MSNSPTSEPHVNLHDSTLNNVDGSQYNIYHAREVIQVFPVYHIYLIGKHHITSLSDSLAFFDRTFVISKS